MKEYRCEKCGKFIIEGLFFGALKKICKSCKHENLIFDNSLPSAAMLKLIKNEEAFSGNTTISINA